MTMLIPLYSSSADDDAAEELPNGSNLRPPCGRRRGAVRRPGWRRQPAQLGYWIVRNSWSSTWGEQGYIYLEMAKNTCGLADDATIPEVKLDMTDAELAEAAVRRELMYQRATIAL